MGQREGLGPLIAYLSGDRRLGTNAGTPTNLAPTPCFSCSLYVLSLTWRHARRANAPR
jgi:hypothetical protein